MGVMSCSRPFFKSFFSSLVCPWGQSSSSCPPGGLLLEAPSGAESAFVALESGVLCWQEAAHRVRQCFEAKSEPVSEHWFCLWCSLQAWACVVLLAQSARPHCPHCPHSVPFPLLHCLQIRWHSCCRSRSHFRFPSRSHCHCHPPAW